MVQCSKFQHTDFVVAQVPKQRQTMWHQWYTIYLKHVLITQNYSAYSCMLKSLSNLSTQNFLFYCSMYVWLLCTYRSLILRPAGKQCPLSSVMSLLLRSRVSTETSSLVLLPSILRILLWCLRKKNTNTLSTLNFGVLFPNNYRRENTLNLPASLSSLEHKKRRVHRTKWPSSTTKCEEPSNRGCSSLNGSKDKETDTADVINQSFSVLLGVMEWRDGCVIFKEVWPLSR